MPTKKTAPSTPSHMIGAGDLDLSIKFLFSFGDFVAVKSPDAEKNGSLIYAETLVFILEMLMTPREVLLF